MVEGGAQEPGSGGDEARTREEVIAGAVWRLAQARARITDAELDLVLASCVLCLPAWEVAVAAGIADPPIDDFGIDRWRRAAREALDDALIPVLYRLAGVPSETRA